MSLKDFASKYIRFALAGATGTAVNLAILYILNIQMGIYVISSEVVAVIIASLWNFVMNLALRVIKIDSK